MSSENLSTMSIPEVSIQELVLGKIDKYGDSIALTAVPDEVSYTFAEVLTNIRKVASGLARLGVKKGDVVAVCSTNSAQYIFLFYACMMNGAVMAQINPRQSKQKIAHMLEFVEASWLYTSTNVAEEAISAAKLVKSIKNVICLGDVMDTVPFSQLISDDGEAYPNTTINPREDLAILACTSGTTGPPKCLMITHYAAVSGCLIMNHPDLSRQGNRVYITAIPFCELVPAYWHMMRCLMEGQRQIIVPELGHELLLQTIERYSVEDLDFTAYIIGFMAGSPLVSKYDLSNIQHVISCGAPLRKEIEAEFNTILGRCCIHQHYGATEGGPFTYQYIDKPRKAGSVGQAAPLVELQVVDPATKKVLGPNEMGEIWAKTPAAMKGYWRQPEATKEKLDKDNWIHTGDMGHYDDDRHFYLVDRYQDKIIFNEYRMSPVKIDCLIINHPSVSDVRVIGVHDPSAGEVPKALVVKKADAELTEKDVMDYVLAKTGDIRHLRGGVEFVNTIRREFPGTPLK